MLLLLILVLDIFVTTISLHLHTVPARPLYDCVTYSEHLLNVGCAACHVS